MANPRQKRKQRSSVAKAGISKASKKNQHKVTIKGPAILRDNWDKTKTVRQNYAALGLLPTLDPRQTGGLEPERRTPHALATASAATVADLDAALAAQTAATDGAASSDEDDDEGDGAAPMKEEEQAPLPPGMARIVRDAQGNVVSIIMGTKDGVEVEEKVRAPERTGDSSDEEEDDDDEEEDEDVSKVAKKKSKGKGRADSSAASTTTTTPWGAPMKDWDAAPAAEHEFGALEGVTPAQKVRQGIPLFGNGQQQTVEAKTDIVRALEERASRRSKVIRHSSQLEHEWLVTLVSKHGDDVAAMARDRKANVWQKTPGELRRAIAKAGGMDKLRALASEA